MINILKFITYSLLTYLCTFIVLSLLVISEQERLSNLQLADSEIPEVISMLLKYSWYFYLVILFFSFAIYTTNWINSRTREDIETFKRGIYKLKTSLLKTNSN